MKEIIKIIYEDYREVLMPTGRNFICCHVLVNHVITTEARNIKRLLMLFVDDQGFGSNNLSVFPKDMLHDEVDAMNHQARIDFLCLLSQMKEKELEKLFNGEL